MCRSRKHLAVLLVFPAQSGFLVREISLIYVGMLRLLCSDSRALSVWLWFGCGVGWIMTQVERFRPVVETCRNLCCNSLLNIAVSLVQEVRAPGDIAVFQHTSCLSFLATHIQCILRPHYCRHFIEGTTAGVYYSRLACCGLLWSVTVPQVSRVTVLDKCRELAQRKRCCRMSAPFACVVISLKNRNMTLCTWAGSPCPAA